VALSSASRCAGGAFGPVFGMSRWVPADVEIAVLGSSGPRVFEVFEVFEVFDDIVIDGR
jgi:hypothetical protein